MSEYDKPIMDENGEVINKKHPANPKKKSKLKSGNRKAYKIMAETPSFTYPPTNNTQNTVQDICPFIYPPTNKHTQHTEHDTCPFIYPPTNKFTQNTEQILARTARNAQLNDFIYKIITDANINHIKYKLAFTLLMVMEDLNIVSATNYDLLQKMKKDKNKNDKTGYQLIYDYEKEQFLNGAVQILYEKIIDNTYFNYIRLISSYPKNIYGVELRNDPLCRFEFALAFINPWFSIEPFYSTSHFNIRSFTVISFFMALLANISKYVIEYKISPSRLRKYIILLLSIASILFIVAGTTLWIVIIANAYMHESRAFNLHFVERYTHQLILFIPQIISSFTVVWLNAAKICQNVRIYRLMSSPTDTSYVTRSSSHGSFNFV